MLNPSILDLFFPGFAPSQATTLQEIQRFGSNPGSLRMLTHVPAQLERNAALVVVLHGSNQTAAEYARGSGWMTLADRHGFAVLFPQQTRSNNLTTSFHWYRPRDTERGQGEARSIAQMIEWMTVDHAIDRKSIFVTGLSAGGAMANVMLAAYPEVFAAGAVIAGLPYAAAANLGEAFQSMSPGTTRAPADWGDRVRAASGNVGPWPRISVWHGDADTIVDTVNARETVKQWVNVHGLSEQPSRTEELKGYRRQVWCSQDDGRSSIEHYSIPGMRHGTPLKAVHCGAAGAYFHDIGVSSSGLIAMFWGLIAGQAEAPV